MILIVDDKQENLFSLKSLLQVNAYEVDTASTGEEALKKVLKNEYLLIILDVQMPGMDGYEVAETITGYSKTKNIPIIFLSAVNIDKRFVTRGYASGGADYVTKPFDPDLLLLKVKSFCRLSEQTRELKMMGDALKIEIETRKQAEKALQHMNEMLDQKVQERTKKLLAINKDLEQSNTELQQFASVASHDLQEPLRKIITFSNVFLEKHANQGTPGETYIKKVIASAGRMRELINDLLNYSKLSAVARFQRTDLKQVLDEAIADLELSITEKNATVNVTDLPSVDIIPGQLRQVFQNILSNALKFSKKEVPANISVQGERIQRKEINGKPDPAGNYVRISISDNGIGFDNQYVEKIFNLFQRLHNRNEYDGTGIGLAIVKKIVEKHNGLISATSQEGQGAKFMIVLPMTQASSLPHSPEQ